MTAFESIEVDWTLGVANVTTRRGISASHRAPTRPPAFAPPRLRTGHGVRRCHARSRRGRGDDLGARRDAARGGSHSGRSACALLAILESMRQHDAIHRAAGSVHSCALVSRRRCWVAVEDVSRHNGVDTISGWMALHGVDGADKILFTTGRLTGEMVIKAAHNGIPLLVSRNGVTAMGYDLAAKFGMTLIGRAVNRRYLCYVGAERRMRHAREPAISARQHMPRTCISWSRSARASFSRAFSGPLETPAQPSPREYEQSDLFVVGYRIHRRAGLVHADDSPLPIAGSCRRRPIRRHRARPRPARRRPVRPRCHASSSAARRARRQYRVDKLDSIGPLGTTDILNTPYTIGVLPEDLIENSRR